MNQKELSIQLHQKMAAEQARYREMLLTLTPAEILEQAHAYDTRENILVAMEHQELSSQQAAALLKLEKPLEAVLCHYEVHGMGVLHNIWNMAADMANSIIQEEQRR